MPQVLKDEVRERIVEAALEVFAARGYEGATMTAIAERAGVATANLYRYYAGKGELFEAALPPALAEEFDALLERRVKALASPTREVERPGEALGGEMLDFWVEHRLAVIILLDRASSTPYASYGERFVERLVSLTVGQIKAQSPGVRLSPAARLTLTQIFESTRRTIAAILEQSPSEKAMREGIEAFWSYQVPGLRGFARWVASAEAR